MALTTQPVLPQSREYSTPQLDGGSSLASMKWNGADQVPALV